MYFIQVFKISVRIQLNSSTCIPALYMRCAYLRQFCTYERTLCIDWRLFSSKLGFGSNLSNQKTVTYSVYIPAACQRIINGLRNGFLVTREILALACKTCSCAYLHASFEPYFYFKLKIKRNKEYISRQN